MKKLIIISLILISTFGFAEVKLDLDQSVLGLNTTPEEITNSVWLIKRVGYEVIKDTTVFLSEESIKQIGKTRMRAIKVATEYNVKNPRDVTRLSAILILYFDAEFILVEDSSSNILAGWMEDNDIPVVALTVDTSDNKLTIYFYY